MIEGADTVLTFEPHPLSVIHPEAAPKLIMPFEIKRDVIDGLGVDELVVIPFDHEFSQIPAEEFCSRILVETLGAERVSVGENFRFGAGAKGDPEMLRSRPEFETRVVPLIEVDGETVSSTRIRALIAAGDVEGAHALPRSAVPARGRGGLGRSARPHARLPDRQPGPGRGVRRTPATASTRRSPTACRRRSTSASGRPSRPAAGC